MTLAVFFPSLMGFGILVSGALLVSDLVNRVLPKRGRRRRHRIALGTYRTVASAAAAAGRRLDSPAFLTRVRRSRGAYLVLTVAAAASGAAVFRLGFAAYGDVRGVFNENPWIYGLTLGFGIAFVMVAATTMALTVLPRRAPAPLQWLVRRSVLGRLDVPDAEGSLSTMRGDGL